MNSSNENGNQSSKDNSNEPLNLSYNFGTDNFVIKTSDKNEYHVRYPEEILKVLSKESLKALLDNFLYTRTIPLLLTNNKNFYYHTARPFVKDLVDYGFRQDLPRIGYEANLKTSELINKLSNSLQGGRISFKNEKITGKILPSQQTSENTAVMSISFGKDSLLSYGVAKEIGFKCHTVYVNDKEGYNSAESQVKIRLFKEFAQEQNQEFYLINDITDNIYRNDESIKKYEDLDRTNAMLAFTLQLIPYAYSKNARYIIFGNEQNLNDFAIDREGNKIFPSYDQTSDFMGRKNKCMSDLTDGNIQVLSLIEPIYNIAEIKIIYSRYPHLLKYLTSCYSTELNINEQWCGHCSMCARIYLYIIGTGNDPRKAGIKRDMLDAEDEQHYPIFNPKMRSIYEEPKEVKDEQKLCFLLAYKNGKKGKLVDLFKKLYLKEALAKEKEYRQKFFSTHPSQTIPENIKDKVIKIYQEELNSLL